MTPPLIVHLELAPQEVELLLLGLNTLPRMQSDKLYREIEATAVQQLKEWREAAAQSEN